MEPSLLEALGMVSPATAEATPGGKAGRALPAILQIPQECEEGCYWRWLVHTLLEDVAALKRNYEETQEGLKFLADRRKEIEERKANRERLVEELAFMTQSLKTLRKEVPQLREEHARKLAESEELKQRSRELQDKQRDLRSAMERSIAWQRANIRKVQAVEREADEGRRQEKAIGDQIHLDREKAHHAQLDLQQMTDYYQALKEEVKELQDSKAHKKAAKKAKAAAKK